MNLLLLLSICCIFVCAKPAFILGGDWWGGWWLGFEMLDFMRNFVAK